jgi:hypothetical protein
MGKAITRELSEIIENIEAHSGAAFHRSAPRDYATELGIEATTIGSATLLSTQKSNSLYFNRVVGLGFRPERRLSRLTKFLITMQKERLNDSRLSSVHWLDQTRL